MKDLAVAELTGLGHQVKVSDLYAMNFEPTVSRDDFKQTQNEDFLKYQMEQMHATKMNGFSQDIQDEQAKLLWANFVIFQFSLWWYSVPAILKGWFDRVFASGFAYGHGIGRYDAGGLWGRKAMLSTTTGSPQTAYTPYGLDGDIQEKTLELAGRKMTVSRLNLSPTSQTTCSRSI